MDRPIYASFGQGQAVCYDLNGKCVWGVHYQPTPEDVRMSSIASPLLAGDVFVDMPRRGQVSVRPSVERRA